VTVAEDDEVLRLIGLEGLSGLGVGYVDAQLLAATRLTADSSLCMNDQRRDHGSPAHRLPADSGTSPRRSAWAPAGVVPEVVGAGLYARRVDDNSW
jgi:hypothetical protein